MRLEFNYNDRGFGDLRLLDGDTLIDDYLCRTGSIDTEGKLKNALRTGEYMIVEPSVDTDEFGMYIHEGNGWKIRLYRVLKDGGAKRTSLLIHPDGGKTAGNGTRGCIGIQGTDAISFRHELDKAMEFYGKLPVKIGRRGNV